MAKDKIILGKPFSEWTKEFPVIEKISKCEETEWLNESKQRFDEAIKTSPLTAADVRDASERLSRFASYFKVAFPETAATDGLLESPIRNIPKMKEVIAKLLELNLSDISIKAKTKEKLDAVGENLAIESNASVMLEKV